VVGSTLDSNFNFDAHAFIWQDDVMTDLSTLFPAESNLFPTMANQITTSRGQIGEWRRFSAGRMRARPTLFWQQPVDER